MLYGVVAAAPNDAWAVGNQQISGSYRTLILHWDGSSWAAVSSPAPGTSSTLQSVALISATNIWAVGNYRSGTTTQTLTAHWDGSAWSVVSSPNNGPGNNGLNGVAATGPTDVWAVGSVDPSGGGATTSTIAHWDGTGWSLVPSVGLGVLFTVDARTPTDAWAGGFTGANGSYSTLLGHWDGQNWSRVASPNGSLGNNYLVGITALAADDAWAVGHVDQGAGQVLNIVEHWNGQVWTLVPNPGVGGLNSLAVFSPNDIWGVGYQISGGYHTLIEHYTVYCSNITATVTPTVPPNCAFDWRTVPSPSGSGDNYLEAVAVWGPNAWAVGSSNGQTLVEYWNGTQWSIVPSPNPSSLHDLSGLAVLAANDAWAVGIQQTSSVNRTLSLHWDGSAWSVVVSPNRGSNSVLYRVAAVAANDVWAVGASFNGSTWETLILHWTGSAWSIVASPNGAGHSYLQGITTLAANDIWAVGHTDPTGGGTTQTLIEHWDGATWSVIAGPGAGSLLSIAAAAPNDIWAVGYAGAAGNYYTLTAHWDGSVWSVVFSPNNGPGNNFLGGVVVLSPADVWAVGAVSPPGGGATTSTIAHWDGTQWSLVPGLGLGTLTSTATGSGEVWAVGFSGQAGSYRTLTGRYALYCVPSPTPTGSPTRTPTLTPTPTPPCLSLQLETSPNRPPDPNLLRGVAALTTTDLWAVGYTNLQPSAAQSLILHNDGTGWSIVPSPNGPSGASALYGVAALAADNVWAVGFTGATKQSFIVHWDGIQWTQVASPSPGLGPNYLLSMTARTATDLWAVGATCPGASCGLGAPYQPFILHGDGATWTVLPATGPGTIDNILTEVTTLSASDAWAVGSAASSGFQETLILHWDGLQWTRVPSPSPGSRYNQLAGVAARTASDAWAVGSSCCGPGNLTYKTLAVHWNGTAWTQAPSPNPGTLQNFFRGVAFDPTGHWLAIGNAISTARRTLAASWDGSAWTLVPSPNSGTGDNVLFDLALPAPGLGWAVGYSGNNTLVERYQDACITPTPSPTRTPTRSSTPSATVTSTPTLTSAPTLTALAPSQTPSATPTNGPSSTPTATSTITPSPTPTATSTIRPSSTPTATFTITPTSTPTGTASATVCPAQFVDVPPGSPFYDFVRCLACRGIVGGYPCGGPGEPCPGPYFRPNNQVTRGQVSKIVAEAARFADLVPSTQQTFADVAPGSTFYLWIERLSGRGIIGGYPCGGPFEPCVAPGNRPYFRPNNPVTRGQLSKIVSGAAEWAETPTGQTFADVVPGSTFYLWIERMASRRIVGGYPCGGPFEPCGLPGNQSYFRPNNNATRGQMSKIAAAAFYPNCQTPTQR